MLSFALKKRIKELSFALKKRIKEHGDRWFRWCSGGSELLSNMDDSIGCT